MPPLVKQSAIYKLIVPEKVEEKIRYLISKFPHTEWSGVLFYKYTGSFEENNLVLTCEDIYPMDLGTAGFTEFKMTPEVSHYIAQNIELFDCEIGNVHSHHSLGAFFSSTDQSTLREGGNDTNCWLMLIVDTKGQYVARITRKIKAQKRITIKDLGSSYEFFGEGERKLANNTSSTKTINREIIEYYDLQVERHEVHLPFESLDRRFDEIQKAKSLESERLPLQSSFNTLPSYLNTPKQSLFDADTAFEAPVNYEFNENTTPDTWSPNQHTIHAAVCRMVACSLIINVEKFDLKQWVTRHMNKRYKEIFPNEEAFNDWVQFTIEFFIYNYKEYTPIPSTIINTDLYYEKISEAIIDELSPFNTDEYPYIQSYIHELSLLIL